MKLLALVVALLLLFSGCQEQTCKKQKQLNPNGDSELALLMREMFTESDSLRQRVMAGQGLRGLKRFETIHSAVATDPMVRGPVFDAFSEAYIQSIRELETADSSSATAFNHMVDQCMNCHTEFCPGPKKRIKKLYVE